jgi:hypothetical protein
MEETVLDWTVPNWITVVLMAILGFAVLGLFGKAIVKAKGGQANA